MDMLSNYKRKLEEVGQLVEKMEKGELSISELSELEVLTREIHERSIILKYKAYEAKVEPKKVVEETPEVQLEPVVEEEPIVAEEEEVVEDSGLDFSLFGNVDDSVEEVVEQEVEISIEQEVVEEKAPEIVEEKTEEPAPIVSIPSTPVQEEVKEEIVPEPTPIVSASGNSFIDRVEIPSDALTGFGSGKIASLIGAFGLNERLRYINDLFDGSSDHFGDAIKSLDSQVSLDAVKPKVDELAESHAWDPEEEVVVEFMTMLKRRYA